MSVKARIVKLGKMKQPKEKLRQITQAYFDSFGNADLQKMVDDPESITPELDAEFNRMWGIRYRLMTKSEQAEIDAKLETVIKELNL
jgi:hypothetical protein